MEKKIFLKISEIKDIFIKKIKTFEDYNTNKNIIISSIEEIEKMLKELFDINIQNNIPTNIESKENNINNQQKEEDKTNQIKQKSNDNTYNNIEKEKENDITKENNNEHEINDNEIIIEIKEGDIDNLNTKNETEGDYIKTYVSILQETDTTVTLLGIEDATEFAAVQDKINSNFEEAGE